ncbi:MAG: hypothetical protein ONA69_05680 [candidate division KSB1 bacterium]|nr:hypothetical protein [candidate division KSB1 bacterium]MDZ7346271.1 hypothetical protein [candidate division KSB1 bacterium]
MNSTNSRFQRIVTHSDFDGVVSASLVSFALGINFIVFTQPRLIAEARISLTEKDIVCDLPYPLVCGMWFDHHEGNLEDLIYRKIDPSLVPGRFSVKDSCARVIFEHYADVAFPPHMAQLVDEADIIDAFNYKSIEEWRRETPARIVDSTIKVKEESAEAKWEYLRQLVRHMQDHPLEEIAQMPSVKKRYRLYQQEEERMIEQIKDEISFLPEDTEHRVMIIDLTRHNRRPNLIKHLAYLVYPQAEAVLQVANLYEDQVKTNNLSFSMSLSLNMNQVEHHKNLGEIMRILNLGSGHPGAAAGMLACSSKEEMLKNKDRLLREIFNLYCSQ